MMKIPHLSFRPDGTVSQLFALLTLLFCVCLIASNLIAAKVIDIFGFSVSCADVIFPISYILNDCLAEVYGFRRTRRAIWLGFFLNLCVVVVSQVVILIPPSACWNDQAAFALVFGSSFRSLVASMTAFLVGSLLNAWVLQRMRVLQHGRHFSLRAIVSSIVGEGVDSCIYVPIMFAPLGWKAVAHIILGEVVVKVGYEVLLLPVTTRVVQRIQRSEHSPSR